jgi:hypothetical protein
MIPLNTYLRSWRGYFGESGGCQTPSVLKSLDEWIRHRLGSMTWKQWKRAPRRFAELRKRGAGKELAAQTVGSCHGPWRISKSPALSTFQFLVSSPSLSPWRISKSPALSTALPNCLWDRLGIERVSVKR